MTTNPYESPESVADDRLPSSVTPPREKGCGSVVALMTATVGGGLAGDVVGNIVARTFWLPPSPQYRDAYDYISIQHPLSLVLLVLGGLVGAFLAIRMSDWVVSN